MNNALTLTAVQPGAAGVLHLTFADGARFEVDMNQTIRQHPSLAALADPAVFARARLGPWGATVSWGSDELELAADNLRARAVEQAGGYSHESIIEWMHRHQLTQQQAADALGVSRRMLGYYLSGEKPVPRTVGLACIGWAHLAHLTHQMRGGGRGGRLAPAACRLSTHLTDAV